ncbi:MAG: hypothetical protein WCS31_00445 [Verrucomicrobiae bacterium]
MKISVLFGEKKVKGTIGVVHGTLRKLSEVVPMGKTADCEFQLPVGGRLEIVLGKATLKTGAFATIINVFTQKNPFSFFLRDVSSETPVYIPEFRVAVVPGDDSRSFQQVADDIAGRALLSDFGRFENEPEESYENACGYNTEQYCQTWLGISRDMRMFRVGYQPRFNYWGQIQPCYHSMHSANPAEKETAYQINFVVGPGSHCRTKTVRRLECGSLPILRAVQDEGGVQYHITSFAALEKEILSDQAVRGSDWAAAYANTHGNMISAEEKEKIKCLLDLEMHEREQEIICAFRVEAVNTARTPNYAFFKVPCCIPVGHPNKYPDEHQFENGMSRFKKMDKVYAVALMNGEAMRDEEMSVLIQPGQKVVFDILVPHSPLALKRAEKLAAWDFEKHFVGCRDFWLKKLDSAAKIAVPEKAIDERIKAGLLHCDITTLGLEPDGAALATIGWYGPIGTESAPIIQFFDSMGWHKLAERSIQFFLNRQQESGFIQNFNNYQSESGPLLWTAGEHFRYTRDTAWLRRVMPKLKKAAGYLLAWRERNKRPELKAAGCYGLVDGKVADPDDFFHAYFLNAGTYLGLSRMVEMTAAIDPVYSKRLENEIKDYRRDIVSSVYHSQARAPLVPIGDGSWAPLLPSWAEYTGAHHLYADGGNSFTHGAFVTRTSLIGANWLIVSEVLEPEERASDFIQKTNQYPMTRENAALSQPYYSRHDFAHIKRGEIKAFLKLYYNQLTGLQDRETYTFWEHYWHASEHKTHEEAWFLMQTRWMLYLEEGNSLSMLKAIPRRWLEDGKKIVLDGVKSYFGAIHFKAESDLKNNRIMAEIAIRPGTKLEKATIRLPHPEGLKARACDTGSYDPETETVTIGDFNGKASVRLTF